MAQVMRCFPCLAPKDREGHVQPRVASRRIELRRFASYSIVAAIRSTRRAGRSWSEIGAMLGGLKQATQRKYASKN